VSSRGEVVTGRSADRRALSLDLGGRRSDMSVTTSE
jgi:hypothetical protein